MYKDIWAFTNTDVINVLHLMVSVLIFHPKIILTIGYILIGYSGHTGFKSFT